MRCVDVNVLLYGFFDDLPNHDQAYRLLSDYRRSPEVTVLLPMVVSGFIRVATDRRIMKMPASSTGAAMFIDELITGPSIQMSQASPSWQTLSKLIDRYKPHGAQMTDVTLAAHAIEMSAMWISYDRGFARFSELNWINPADSA